MEMEKMIFYDPRPANSRPGPVMKISCPKCGALNLSGIRPGYVDQGDAHITDVICGRCSVAFYFIVEVTAVEIDKP